jgi:intein-encoded DNA endonuclease-like protein
MSFPVFTSQRFEPFALNEHPKDLSYILGVLCGDGYITYQKYIFGVHVADFEFAQSAFETLKRLGLHPRMYREPKYARVVVTKKRFYLLLEKARENLENYVSSSVDFIRGFYESEGSLGVYKHKNKNSMTVMIRFINTNRKFLDLIHTLLEELGIESRVSLHRKAGKYVIFNERTVRAQDCYVLYIYGIKRVRKFLELVNPCIYRKSLAFLQDKLNEWKVLK